MSTSRTSPIRPSALVLAVAIIAAVAGVMADPAAAATPVLTVPGAQSIATNGRAVFKGANGITVADTDTTTHRLVLAMAGGTPGTRPKITLHATTGLTFTVGDGTSDESLTATGSLANVNGAMAGMQVDALDPAGTYALNITVQETATGAGLGDHEAIAVTVTDDAPTASVPAIQKVPQGGSAKLQATVGDVDSTVLSISLISDVGVPADHRPQFAFHAAPGVVLDSAASGTAISFHGTKSAVVAAVAAVDLLPNTGGFTGTFGFDLLVADAFGGTDPNTAQASGDIQVVRLPGEPTGITATVTDTAQVRVSWVPPADAGTAALTGYLITPIRAGVALAPEARGLSLANEASLSIDAEVPYAFTVAAVSADGTGPASPPTTVVTAHRFFPFPSAGALVDRTYLDLLGRGPTATERAAAAPKIADGTVDPGALVVQLRTSAESQTTVDPVTRLYRAYFLRIPDVGGLTFWIKRKRGGAKLDTISQTFATSSEFKTRYGSLSNAAFVDLIYQNLFSRDGDAGGVAFWTRQLDQHRRNRGQVMAGFSESNEYKTKQVEEVEVSVLNIFLLGVAPSQSAFDSAVGQLESGAQTVLATVQIILRSAAYRQRVG